MLLEINLLLGVCTIMKVLDKRQPSFIQFRDIFLDLTKKVTGKADIDPFMPWREIGDVEVRKEVLQQIKSYLEEEYGFETIIKEDLVDDENSVESVAIQVHHTFCTIYLMERIYAKAALKQQQLNM